MNLFYSKTTGGFYREDVHGDNMPNDVVPVSKEVHDELMFAQGTGKRIVADQLGNPIAADQPGPTQDDINIKAKLCLQNIDLASVRSIREWLAAQPGAPEKLQELDDAAKVERAKLK